MDDFPTDYDAIVVGTGMIESVVAAALSRIGKSVLHLDSNKYYGENWASFSLEGLENWIKNPNDCDNSELKNQSIVHLIDENEKIVEINCNANVWNAQHTEIAMKEKKSEKEIQEESAVEETSSDNKPEEPLNSEVDKLQRLSRRFNLDLCPKLLFSKGILVQLLITSNIARYAEFKSVSRVLTWRDGQLEPVPCSRADVFVTKNVTVVHKRILVKILTLFANYTENLDEFKGFENKTFLEYLKYKKLPENLIHYILYAIAMGDNSTSCLDGVKNCKAFLESLGIWGNTPFIFPMYGSGELPQCFCRLCAVFGGVYCLQRGIEALVVKEDECTGVISNNKRLNAKTVILSSKYAIKDNLVDSDSENISRGIFITDSSILKGEKESLTLLQFPPIPQVSEKSVTVIELSSETCTCPENYFIVHMTAKMTKDAYSDLKHVVEALFETENHEKSSKPKVIWSTTWNVSRKSSKAIDSSLRNVKICSSVDSELDYKNSINEAKRIFQELYPDEEFLPRAPDPDEIVLDVDEAADSNCKIIENNSKEIPDISEKGPEDICDTDEKNLFQTPNKGNEKAEETEPCDKSKSSETNLVSTDS